MRSTGPGSREQGLATVELAVGLPAIVLVAALLLSAVRLGIDLTRCYDAAYAVARAIARGESDATARGAAVPRAPSPARIEVIRRATTVTVRVTGQPPGPLAALSSEWQVVGQATAALETPTGAGGPSG